MSLAHRMHLNAFPALAPAAAALHTLRPREHVEQGLEVGRTGG